MKKEAYIKKYLFKYLTRRAPARRNISTFRILKAFVCRYET
jgi:hypothetical protein